MESQEMIIKQYEAIRHAAHTDYVITSTDDRYPKNDSIMGLRPQDNAINHLLKRRKDICRELEKGNMIETKESLELFEHLNNEIKRYLYL